MNTIRLDVRLPKHVHELVTHAARLKGQTVTSFVAAAVEEAARCAIRDDEILRAALDSQRRIMKALLKPQTKPGATLRR